MHSGRIDRDTGAGRVYRVLRGRAGEWIGGWDLTIAARTTAVSTRVSEVREQLPAGEVVERRGGEGRRQFYRLVVAGSQLELAGAGTEVAV